MPREDVRIIGEMAFPRENGTGVISGAESCAVWSELKSDARLVTLTHSEVRQLSLQISEGGNSDGECSRSMKESLAGGRRVIIIIRA